MGEEIAIVVKFINMQGIWSKGYTYKYHEELAPETIVVVPQRGFFTVGRVIKSVRDYNFNPGIEYKHIFKTI